RQPVGALRVEDADRRRQAGDQNVIVTIRTDRVGPHRVRGGSAIEDDVVAGGAPATASPFRQVDVHGGNPGAGQVVDDDGVGAPAGVEPVGAIAAIERQQHHDLLRAGDHEVAAR